MIHLERAADGPAAAKGVSVVIPTRNRSASLRRALASLAAQERPPDEVIIVDASDEVDDLLPGYATTFPIHVVRTQPHLCRQRNEGIRRTCGDYVLLCDDDVEVPRNYVGQLLAYLTSHPEEGAVTGAFREPGRSPGDRLTESFPRPSPRHLAFVFVFQLTAWGDVQGVDSSRWSNALLSVAKRFYRRRGNTWSLAGWPLVTQVRGAEIRTATYGLAAALVRREWLLASPFDEGLGQHGIGDNYGVALGFPRCPGIVVLRNLEVIHHRAPEGRMPEADAYLARVLALAHFVRSSDRFAFGTRAFLVWSLMGSCAAFAARRQWLLLGRALRAIGVVVSGRNPLRRALTPDPGTRESE